MGWKVCANADAKISLPTPNRHKLILYHINRGTHVMWPYHHMYVFKELFLHVFHVCEHVDIVEPSAKNELFFFSENRQE